MKYIKATQVLPPELLAQVQEYVDGEYLYIPRAPGRKQNWGTNTATRSYLRERNQRIYQEFISGESPETLAQRYYLSVKSIQRILSQLKKEP